MDKKKKVYISLPIANNEKTVMKRYLKSIMMVSTIYPIKEYYICGPINIGEFTANGLKHEREHNYSWYMGKDIEILLDCDAIFMSDGWETSKGCQAELAVAKIYGIPVYYASGITNIKFK